MKCSGKVGYFLNLKKEYGERANSLLKNLEDEKNAQGAFITDFIKSDIANISKVLMYITLKGKVKTSVDGLYVDKKFHSLLTHSDGIKKNENIYHEIGGSENVEKRESALEFKSSEVHVSNWTECTQSDELLQLEDDDISLEKSEGMVEKSEGMVEKSEIMVEKPEGMVEKSEIMVEKPEGMVEKPEGMVEKPEGMVEKSSNLFKNCGPSHDEYAAPLNNSPMLLENDWRKSGEIGPSSQLVQTEGNAMNNPYEENNPCGTSEHDNVKKLIINKEELLNSDEVIKCDGVIKNIEKIIYYMNPCSVLSAYFLDVKKGDKVLDMCGAPGGKSLVLANKLFAYESSPLNRIKDMQFLNNTDIEVTCSLNKINYYKTCRHEFLVVNECNKSRYERLKQVLCTYLPEDLINSSNLHITNYNGLNLNAFMRFPKFHKILLDVPCSADEHMFKKGTQVINKWTFNVIKNNASMQFDLLVNAFFLLHTNGFIVYSTCAMSHYENDDVIEKLLTKFKNQVRIVDFLDEEYRKRYQEIFPMIPNNPIIRTAVHSEHNHVSGKDGNTNIDTDNSIAGCSENAYCSNYSNDNKIHEHTFFRGEPPYSGPSSECNLPPRIHFNEYKDKTNFLKFFEKTKYGYISLPDKSPFGILYICKIQKIEKCNQVT
ncbi:tRNA m5C-methyltransferase, putative [Plasmodium ovale]|uniref:NOL1/NOP2/Sun domain family member 4 n=1 Tax=Plasmodium ovale TaxID=36330 RepID=A0A1C3KS64_PLAOA|nr:tRNA m5C-methyltransferase, putative [Plasmodium ovale]